MLIKKAKDIPSSEITPKKLYLNRRKFLAEAAAAAGVVGAAALAGRPVARWLEPQPVLADGEKLPVARKSPYSTTTDKITPYQMVTNYNNYYEFSLDKYAPAHLCERFQTSPWTVAVEGEVEKPGTFSVDELMKLAPLEERVFRHRCVEAWSIVVPWIGFPLSALINRVKPTSKAKYVQYITALKPSEMPDLRQADLDWPYREGLRMDEAMNPLATLCFGMYGEVLPKQDGAPVRMVVPWKYGFKSGKAIVKFRFVEKQPNTTWNTENSDWYGFYSNVNPNVDRPRWSQATERRLGEFFKRKTLMFNGYGNEVASMYSGMDLSKYY
jgi:methionine sulfoxide reductase catalytic subunit